MIDAETQTTAAAVDWPGWFDRTLLGVEAWRYLAIIGLLLGAMTARAVLEYLLRRYFRALLARSGHVHLQRTIDGADRALGFLAFAVIVLFGIPFLRLPHDAEVIAKVAARALTAVGAVWMAFRVLDVLFDWLAGKADRTDSRLDDQLVPILRRTVKTFAAIVGGLFVLQNLDIDVGSLLAGLGLGGLAFALAARDTVANFFGSVMVFVDKPFTIGDWVMIAGHEGTVEEVGFRTSRVRTFYDSVLTIPNAMMTTAIIDNYGARRYRRYSTRLGITYDTPPEQVQAFCEGIRAIIQGHPGMRKDYYLIEFDRFGDFALEIMVYCFMIAPSWSEELRTRTQLNLEILRLADQLGVRFAFPTRTLHVESQAIATAAAPPRPPRAPEELAAVVDAFGPGGRHARPAGVRISAGHDAAPTAMGSDGDG